MSPFGLDDGTVTADGVPTAVDVETVGVRALPAGPADTYRGDVERAISDLEKWRSEGYRVVVVHSGHGPAQRMVEALGEHDVAAVLVEPDEVTEHPGVVEVTCGSLAHGFVDETNRVALLTGEDLSGQRASTRDMRAMPARRKKQIDPLELKAGDYVVHEQHGVGRFVEMKQREVQGAVREYLVLEYGAAKRGAPPTGSTFPPTPSTRSPGTSGASSPASTGSAVPTGPSARAGPARRCARSPPS